MSLTQEQLQLLNSAIDLYYYRDVLKLESPKKEKLPIKIDLSSDEINKTLKITLDVGANSRIINPPKDEAVFYAVGSSSNTLTWQCYLYKQGSWVDKLKQLVEAYSTKYNQILQIDDHRYFNLEYKEIPYSDIDQKF